MARKKPTGHFEEHETTSEREKRRIDQGKAKEREGASLFQGNTDTLQTIGDHIADPHHGHVCHDPAEDADDELDTGDDKNCEEIRPLNIQKANTGKEGDLVHSNTKYPDQNPELTAHMHGHVKWADGLAQVEKSFVETGHKARSASQDNLSQDPMQYPALATNPSFGPLQRSPALRRSHSLRATSSDSISDYGMMPKTRGHQNFLHGHMNDHNVDKNESSSTYQTSNGRGKMLEVYGKRNKLSGEIQSNPAEIGENAEASKFTQDQILKPNSSSLQKAHIILNYDDEDIFVPEKIRARRVSLVNVSREKKSFFSLFHFRESKGPIPIPSSEKSEGHGIISTPPLSYASPNEKSVLGFSPSIVEDPLGANNAVNYSRPIATQSTSAFSNGSPIRREESDPSRSSKRSSTSHTSPVGRTDGSGKIPARDTAWSVSHDINLPLPDADKVQIHNHTNVSAVHGTDTTYGHNTEKRPDASENDSFNPSEYSGKEYSVKKAERVPIIFKGRAKMVDVRPPLTTNTSDRSGGGTSISSGPVRLTDREAEALGAQDADRYLSNAMTSQKCPTRTDTNDLLINIPYRNLLAKPANEIAAKEMARIKDARDTRNANGGLMERIGVLRVKNDGRPEIKSTGAAVPGPRTKTGEEILMKMRALRKKKRNESKKEIEREVKADVKRGLREESEIHSRIKAELVAKAAVSGGLYGAGVPRIDYGPPSMSTALRGCDSTDEERAHARALAARRAASSVEDCSYDNRDNTTARGHLEGC